MGERIKNLGAWAHPKGGKRKGMNDKMREPETKPMPMKPKGGKK